MSYDVVRGPLELQAVEGHPDLWLHILEDGEHLLFRQCSLCGDYAPLEDTFVFMNGATGEDAVACMCTDNLAANFDNHCNERNAYDVAFKEWMAQEYPPTITAAMRRQVFERDAYRCRYCGGFHGGLSLDHVVPQSRGGSHAISNLVTACSPCNGRKRDRTPDEAGMPLRPLAGDQA